MITSVYCKCIMYDSFIGSNNVFVTPPCILKLKKENPLIVTDKVCNPDHPLKWGSHMNLHHVSKATRGIHWGTAAKRYFKRFINFFFLLYLVRKHQTCQGLLLFYQHCHTKLQSSPLEGLQTLILIICRVCFPILSSLY